MQTLDWSQWGGMEAGAGKMSIDGLGFPGTPRETEDGSLPVLMYGAEDRGEMTFAGLLFHNWLQRGEYGVTKKS